EMKREQTSADGEQQLTERRHPHECLAPSRTTRGRTRRSATTRDRLLRDAARAPATLRRALPATWGDDLLPQHLVSSCTSLDSLCCSFSVSVRADCVSLCPSVVAACSLLRQISTSYSSSTPRSRRMRSRISSASASASAARASSPSVTMKLAWTGETVAPPRCWPFMPSSSISLPVERLVPGGFLKKQPALRAPCGCESM